MLTFDQIKDLIDQVAKNRLGGLELELSDFRLKVDGYTQAATTVVHHAPAAPQAPPGVAIAPGAEAPLAALPATPSAPALAPAASPNHVLTSPFVGTFYRSPNPNSPPFAPVGATVTRGQVLCIVEAMKLMNEIESDVDGTIVKVFPENAQPVEFGEPLFEIKAH
jgi:acetyl-CoA carboxylase biotin carboxyl carrier protein